MTYQVATNQPEITQLCQLGLLYRLHCNIGLLKNWYLYPKYVPAFAYVANSIGIGVAVYVSYGRHDCVSVYVKEEYRKQGIGLRLLETLNEVLPKIDMKAEGYTYRKLKPIYRGNLIESIDGPSILEARENHVDYFSEPVRMVRGYAQIKDLS